MLLCSRDLNHSEELFTSMTEIHLVRGLATKMNKCVCVYPLIYHANGGHFSAQSSSIIENSNGTERITMDLRSVRIFLLR